jgi:uncharacterized protein YidB (DUF937 family)
MLDNLLALVKEHAGDAIVNNTAVPNEKNDAAIESTTHSIVDVLKNQLTSGNASALTDLFQNGNGSNAVLNTIGGEVAKNLSAKLGIDQGAASGIAASLIPQVMNSLVKKTNDPNDSSFDLQGVIGSLGGSNSMVNGVLDMLNQGGEKNASAESFLGAAKGLFGK